MKLRALLLPLLLCGLVSCQHSLPQYLTSQGLQQGAIYLKAQPIKELLGSSQLSPKEEKYLTLSLEVLDFAKHQLGMKTGRAYQNYSRIQNKAVTWVVVAAHKDQLKAHLFHYPVLGALPYRGYFRESDAKDYAHILEGEDLDVIVRPVRAYSSTGWLADPVITTMFSSELEFIELLFHELLHLQFYWPGQADFNEAFATWFAQKATISFLKQSKTFQLTGSGLIQKYQKILEQDRTSLSATQEVLNFAASKYATATPENLKEIRETVFSGVKRIYAEAGLKKLSEAQWNNAKIISLSTYLKLLPEIEKEFATSKLDFVAFTKRVAEAPEGQWPPSPVH